MIRRVFPAGLLRPLRRRGKTQAKVTLGSRSNRGPGRLTHDRTCRGARAREPITAPSESASGKSRPRLTDEYSRHPLWRERLGRKAPDSNRNRWLSGHFPLLAGLPSVHDSSRGLGRELSRFGGSATIVPASDYVSTFRDEGVKPDLVALPVGLRFYVSRR
jgi:hypothetical protein